MNTLEQIALEKLRNEVIDIMDRAHESNEDKFQNQRIYIRNAAQRALGLIKALEENNKQP